MGLSCRSSFCWLWVATVGALTAMPSDGATPGFADFDRRAQQGERLNVVFFGASLTWGANASDPQQTSYRGQVARRLEEAYPSAHFKFHDAAIGATGSQLGVFRLDRDVLAHRPDLVFLDFSANDDIYSADPERLASYEAIVRRIILDGHAPVVEVILPFMWNVTQGKIEEMARRRAHLEIAKAYHVPAGDAIALAIERIKAGQTTAEKLWPVDGVHPGDAGYVLFTDAAWSAFQQGVAQKLVSAAPEKMLNAATYMKNARVRISSLGPLPKGWRVGRPNVVSAYFDMLMSRWLDDEVIASRYEEAPKEAAGADAKKPRTPQKVEPLKVRFRGQMVMLFGESTPTSGKFRALIDGKVIERQPDRSKPPLDYFDAGAFGRMVHGNTHLSQLIATGLDPATEHTLEIEPVFTDDTDEELRIESICVAGEKAGVTLAPSGKE
ncbi:MAG: SGNH/GDSL hydrolase family protein [Phycisphaerae bacterium]|nr:SGNH/GDSL hydrolase family protein [Phycisphaerae bacterium]